MDILIMQTSRNAYSKEDAAKNSLTVGELIAILEQYDEDDVIVTSHDRGYTFGRVKERDFDIAEADDEE